MSRITIASSAALLKAMVYSAMRLPSGIEKESERVVPHVSKLDEERFGKAPESLCKPLLIGRKGKGTRKQRKALKAKLEAQMERRAKLDAEDFVDYIEHVGLYSN